jgi:uncharacterized protein with gpF-like domain
MPPSTDISGASPPIVESITINVAWLFIPGYLNLNARRWVNPALDGMFYIAAVLCPFRKPLMPRLRDKTGKEIVLRPVWANAGIRAAYRRNLDDLIREMQTSYVHWLRAQFRETPPRMAQDATPAKELKAALAKLGKRWQRNFDEASEKLARWFARSAASRSDAGLRSILRKGGFSVKFTMTPAMRDVLDATIAENMSLIKSIASEYHTQVEGLVARSVTAGRDLSFLTDELEKRYGITRRRAALISRDQNNKSTSMLQRVRYVELGITEAIWLHSSGGRVPRPTHVKNSGERYNIVKGWYDPAVKRFILPGELVNCRCVARPVVKGFS